MQQILNDARAAGEAIAKSFVDQFEQGNGSPSAKQIATFERKAAAHFAGLSCPWVDGEIVEAWHLAMAYHLAARIKTWRRPKNFGAASLQQAGATTELLGSQRGFSPSFGITK